MLTNFCCSVEKNDNSIANGDGAIAISVGTKTGLETNQLQQAKSDGFRSLAIAAGKCTHAESMGDLSTAVTTSEESMVTTYGVKSLAIAAGTNSQVISKGNNSLVFANVGSSVIAQEDTLIVIAYMRQEGKKYRYDVVVKRVGEDGILPGRRYIVAHERNGTATLILNDSIDS